MAPEKKLRLLRKAVADAYGKDRSWMREPGRASDLVRDARRTQELLLRTAKSRGTLDAAIKEIESLCLLVEELLRAPKPPEILTTGE
jgi:hypothetical protein